MPFFKSKAHHGVDHPDPHESRLEILLDREYVFLRGSGADVEPALISGNVALYLTEPTALRSISLQFRGKAYLPDPPQENQSSSTSASTFIVCKHDWSFLEGPKKHNHTLKAGKHLFPFQLQVGGAIPRSVITDAFGGASITYKLRAVAQRAGAFSHNIQAVVPVYLVRSLGSTSLEYQQTNELEHAWAGKLLFSVAIPHSAWAAGDEFVALLKVSPLVKGVGVLSITTSLRETTRIHGRPNPVTRTVASVTHEILGGKAVEMRDPVDKKGKFSQFNLPLSLRSPATPLNEAGPSTQDGRAGSNIPSHTQPQPPHDPAQSEDDIVTTLPLRIPRHLSPSHPLEPIRVSHLIHWSVLVTNADGHISELYCSLPVILLDSQLLSEAQAHTKLARQLLVGGPEVLVETAPEAHELPSYIEHVRDRVANMFLPEGQTLRVTNPWIQLGVSPIFGDQPQSCSSNGSPLQVISDSNDAYVPDPDHPVFLDWVNAELLISHGVTKYPRLTDPGTSTPDDGGSQTPGSDHPPTPPTPPTTGVTTYTHTSAASRELPQIFTATLEPTSTFTHPNWLSARPDPKDPRVSSVDIQRRVKEVSVPHPEMESVLLHRAFTEVPDYEVALRGFLGGVPPLSSMHGLPSYDEASRSGTPELGAKHVEGSSSGSAADVPS
ncbi:arrestin-C domain-containing protein [Favolaschia claudopus]|uniref:Arrestin-C domain-containing protein n=1 Tax=Favolaschia claudopus TaxID=2862362 RepID=A0AAW0BZQ9_9AGAR